MRMTRHDYDLLYRVYSSQWVQYEQTSSRLTVNKLTRMGCLTTSDDGRLDITDYGRAQLQRVRGVGKGLFQTPRGYTLVPTNPTPEMLEAARRLGPVFNASSYRLMLLAAPKVKT